MSLLEVLRRIAARVTGTYLGRFKTGELATAASLSLAQRAVAACPNLWLVDATRTYPPESYLKERAEVARGDDRHLLIVVDSIHSWSEAHGGELSEYEILGAHLAKLRALGSSLECPVLAVAERNRGAMKAGGLSAGAGTRKLEYGSESVWDLQRDPEVKDDVNGEVPVTLRLAKNRNGAAGKSVELRFCGRLQRFREVL
jgi:replicative DNA helicase